MDFDDKKIKESLYLKEEIIKKDLIDEDPNKQNLNCSQILKHDDLFFMIQNLKNLGQPKTKLPDRLQKYKIFRYQRIKSFLLKVFNFLDKPNRNRYNSLLLILEKMFEIIEEDRNGKK